MRLVWSWLRISGVPVVAVVSVVIAWIGWSSGSRPTGVPGLRYHVSVEAILPCLVALGSTAGLVDGWMWILRHSPRPVWAVPVARLGGTVLVAGLPWLVTITDPFSQRVLPLVVAGVAVAACSVSVLGSYGWVPLVPIAYVFLTLVSQHSSWVVWPHPWLAAISLVTGCTVYVAAAVRRVTP
jgi:hypothetical protein